MAEILGTAIQVTDIAEKIDLSREITIRAPSDSAFSKNFREQLHSMLSEGNEAALVEFILLQFFGELVSPTAEFLEDSNFEEFRIQVTGKLINLPA